MPRKFASLFAAIAIAAASLAPASAEQGRRTIHVTVSYADLDLTRAEGAKTLSIRLNRAADKTCGHSRQRFADDPSRDRGVPRGSNFLRGRVDRRATPDRAVQSREVEAAGFALN